ncbi:ribosome biogenesis GTPase YlqF [bacterium]|nr:ribosome biogenesis GTPase YlqF [bacterium]
MKKDKTHIHWYPGHIAKAERKLKEQLSLVDAVIEVIDARIPLSSRYDNITGLLNQKPRFLLVNKSDLVDKNELDKYIEILKKETGTSVIPTSAKSNKDLNLIVREAVKLSEPRIAAIMAKGLLRRPARIMVVGLPNVGKSSIINKLTRTSKTKTGAKAGVTRQQQWVRINPQLELLDTPGIIPMKQEDQERAIKLAFVNSVGDNAYSNDFVAKELLNVLNDKQAEVFKEYYGLGEEELTLENIALNRKWLIKNQEPDIERTAGYVLKDFREGKIGKFILDSLSCAEAN